MNHKNNSFLRQIILKIVAKMQKKKMVNKEVQTEIDSEEILNSTFKDDEGGSYSRDSLDDISSIHSEVNLIRHNDSFIISKTKIIKSSLKNFFNKHNK